MPYIVERSLREVTRTVVPRVSQKETRTIVEISGLDPSQPPDAVMLFASAPDYFSRDVTVLETERDARGVTGDRVLGSARWERLPGEKPRPLTIAIAPVREKSLRAEIENGDNAPLAIDKAAVKVPFVRIDFVFAPGEKLTLVSDNRQAAAPRFDLAMIADRVLAAPAQPARLGPPTQIQPAKALPGWFWAAVVVAALFVAGALLRTLRAEGLRAKP